MAGVDWETVRAELEAPWLDGLERDQRKEGALLLDDVVEDWAREADAQPDPAAVLRFQREELDELRSGRDGPGRLDALRTRVLGRQVDRVSVEAFALSRAVLGGSVADAEARELGTTLLEQAKALGAQTRGLQPGPRTDAIRRELSEATMDALYAVERKAMSLRLAREAGAAP